MKNFIIFVLTSLLIISIYQCDEYKHSSLIFEHAYKDIKKQDSIRLYPNEEVIDTIPRIHNGELIDYYN